MYMYITLYYMYVCMYVCILYICIYIRPTAASIQALCTHMRTRLLGVSVCGGDFFFLTFRFEWSSYISYTHLTAASIQALVCHATYVCMRIYVSILILIHIIC